MTRIFVADIIRVACEIYDVSMDEMLSPNRGAVCISTPRQRAMYVAREMTGHSYPTIAKAFRRKDHTTIMNACRNVTAWMEADPAEAAAVGALMARFRRRAA